MRLTIRYILGFMLVLSAILPAAGDGLIEVTASIDKQSAYIGDLLNYSIAINYDSTIRLTPPAVGLNLGGFDVKDYHVGEEITLENGRRQQVLDFKIYTFTTGEFVIPPLPLEYMLSDSSLKYIAAEPIRIEVKSLLGEGDTIQLRGLKAQASIPKDRTTMIIIIISAVVVIVGIVLYILWRKRKNAVEEEYVDPRPAHEIAFTDLALLKEKDLPGKGELKRFYFELTEIYKRYLDKKFEFNAIDMTTEEIGDWLDESGYDQSFRTETDSFMQHADLVKFAKYVPSEDLPPQDLDTAHDLVDNSRQMEIRRPIVEEIGPMMLAISDIDDEYLDSDLRFAPPELRQKLASGDDGGEA